MDDKVIKRFYYVVRNIDEVPLIAELHYTCKFYDLYLVDNFYYVFLRGDLYVS